MKFMKLGAKPDSFQTDGRVRFVATELATDIIINVGDVKFYLHKFPLLSKSSQLQKLVTTTDDETHVDEIHISDIYKIDVFLASSIFQSSWKDSVIVLKTTKSLLPWSDDLRLVGHCIDAIAARASVEAPKVDWWVEDLCELELDLFKRVVAAIRTEGRVSREVIGEAVRAIHSQEVPRLGKGRFVKRGDVTRSRRTLLETVVSLLPEEKGSVSCSFMLKLFRTC